jgi:membrane protease YdiL (CAAX protease family)
MKPVVVLKNRSPHDGHGLHGARSSRWRALLALALLAPAPSVGVLFGMVLLPNTAAGALIFGLSKVWLLALPLIWRLAVDRAPLSLSPVRRGGFGVGALTGLVISVVILAAYAAFGRRLIDPAVFVEKLRGVGLGAPGRYAVGALYWTGVNSVLEEYVWRWFCVRQCEKLLPRVPAVLCSALFFTVHHVLAMGVYMGGTAVALCALGVFTGGAVWSALYVRYRSIWPAYLSHALVDACIFILGAALLFG